MPSQISAEFIEMLRCPENRSRLAAADPALLARVNAAISQRTLKNMVGQTVERSLDAGLIREDRTVIYPIVEDIPILLAEEGILLSQLEG